MRIGIIFLALLLSQPLLARDVYKWTTEEGEVVYSENYQPGAERIQVIDKKKSISLDLDKLDSEAQAAANGEYTDFSIVQPGDKETIRTDGGTVSVGISLSPPLASGHVIHLYVDGTKLSSDITTTQMVLEKLSRGTHTLNAKVIDAKGNTVKESGNISFHLRQALVE
ncbi:MAG: DUF4124 domain-containing protein [Candidatus Thiodiazotropha sp.]|jgi:hypothetical protein